MAANTGINDGGIARLFIDAPATQVVVTHLINCSVNYSMDPREVTTKTSALGARDFRPGLTGWTMSGEAYFAEDAAYGYTDIFTLIKNRTQVQVQYGSLDDGDKIYRGAAYITAINRSSGNQGENESYTVEIQGTGALAEATQQT